MNDLESSLMMEELYRNRYEDGTRKSSRGVHSRAVVTRLLVELLAPPHRAWVKGVHAGLLKSGCASDVAYSVCRSTEAARLKYE